MSPKGNRGSLVFHSPWKLGYLLLIFASIVNAGPLPGTRLERGRSPSNTRLQLYSTPSPSPRNESEQSSLAWRGDEPDRYGLARFIDRDKKGTSFYEFSDSLCQFASGIVTLGAEVAGTDRLIRTATILTFNESREVGRDVESKNWGGRKARDDPPPSNAVAESSARQSETSLQSMIAEAEVRKKIIFPDIYKVLTIEAETTRIQSSLTLVIMKPGQSLQTMLQERGTNFDNLVMFRKWAALLASAHSLNYAHHRVNPSSLWTTGSNDWGLIAWDDAIDLNVSGCKSELIHPCSEGY